MAILYLMFMVLVVYISMAVVGGLFELITGANDLFQTFMNNNEWFVWLCLIGFIGAGIYGGAGAINNERKRRIEWREREERARAYAERRANEKEELRMAGKSGKQ